MYIHNSSRGTMQRRLGLVFVIPLCSFVLVFMSPTAHQERWRLFINLCLFDTLDVSLSPACPRLSPCRSNFYFLQLMIETTIVFLLLFLWHFRKLLSMVLDICAEVNLQCKVLSETDINMSCMVCVSLFLLFCVCCCWNEDEKQLTL